MIIRNAIESDVTILNSLFQQLVEYERQNYDSNIKKDLIIDSYFDKRIHSGHEIVLVALVNDVVVGYCYSIIDFDNKIKMELEGRIDSIFVVKEYRNRNIGTELINKSVAELKDKGVKHIFITNIYENSKAGKLYNKLGFKIFKEERKLL